MGLLSKLQNVLSKSSLTNTYKAFIRPYLKWFTLDQACNKFNIKMKPTHYDAALATTYLIRDASQQNLYEELCFESVDFREWFRMLSRFYKNLQKTFPRVIFFIRELK